MKKKKDYAERIHPGDPEPERCAPGSIERQLDMCEPNPDAEEEETEEPRGADEMLERFGMDLSEPGREGDEMSGDDHSSGKQGKQGEETEGAA
ncbi:MAG: hypothetical protein NDJ90_16130 [Oligoflexia bacterium]|nr:hypothetical protein [Oligoflexia bacterium]